MKLTSNIYILLIALTLSLTIAVQAVDPKPLHNNHHKDSFEDLILPPADPSKHQPITINHDDFRELPFLNDDLLEAFLCELSVTPQYPPSVLINKKGVQMGGTFFSLQNPEWPPLPGNMINRPFWEMDGFYLLNDLNYDYKKHNDSTDDKKQKSGVSAKASVSAHVESQITMPDYGTNLWIAQLTLTNGFITGIGTNTEANVPYEILSCTDLLQTNWQSEGFIYGSESTNWTPLSLLPVTLTNNMFFRLRSWASGGSGMPLWWQLQYFGITDVDPYDNPAGDGYDNLQKFENGMNPNLFYTPAAPQGLTAELNLANQTATITWMPSAGSVISYTIEKIYKTNYWDTPVTNYFTTTNTSYTDSIADNALDPWSGDVNLITYAVKANYATSATLASGVTPHSLSYCSSPWTFNVPLLPTTVTGQIVPSPDGQTYFVPANIPANATNIQLGLFYYFWLDNSLQTNVYNISVSSLSNGRFVIPSNWFQAPVKVIDGYTCQGDLYGTGVRSVNYNGVPSTACYMYYDFGTPFYDGRAQLKQNLIFKLRAAPLDSAVNFSIISTNIDDYGTFGAPVGDYNSPSNYCYAGLYQFEAYGWNFGVYGLSSGGFDSYMPFRENNLLRNFVYSQSNVDENGHMTTGVRNYIEYGYDTNSGYVELMHPPAYEFTTEGMNFTPLLATSNTRWLYYDNFNGAAMAGLVIPDTDEQTYFNVSLPFGMRNHFGLTNLSALLVYQRYDNNNNALGMATNILYAGNTLNMSINDYHDFAAYQWWYSDYNYYFNNVYLETDQPKFKTVKYCFYTTDNWIPGSELFTPTNDSPSKMTWDGTNYSATSDLPFLIVPAGTSRQIAGYAKLEVTNGYPNTYAYLGQYFDQAYKVNGNGSVTTNTTGILTPSGKYFATEVGTAALVTMPDIDPPYQRGTCMVYSVSLQLDKNHDGIMDGDFNGPDATSEASPMVFWINNDRDYHNPWGCTVGTPRIGKDMNADGDPDYHTGMINSVRDLEDFARLWICGIPTLINSNYQVTLSWTNVRSGNPAIRLFESIEADGGIKYLTSTNVAATQAALDNYFVPTNGVWYMHPGWSIANMSNGAAFTFPANYFTNNANKYFLFEGSGIGSGELMLTISQNSNIIAQTGVWLDLHDVKDFYERTIITNIYSANISNWTSSVKITKPATASVMGDDNDVIVFVHGINVPMDDWIIKSETVIKRLYWAGYGGKFLTVKWPCLQGLQTIDFNISEIYGYKAADALKVYLDQLSTRFPSNRVHIFAHSQGNAVVGEAIRKGAKFDTYILSQGAMPASAYDVNAPIYTNLLNKDYLSPTPEWQPMGYRGIYTNSDFSGRIVNFYNYYDPVLNVWIVDQLEAKPNNALWNGGDYVYNPNNNQSWFVDRESGYQRLVTDPQESRSMVSRSRTLPIGQSGPITQHGVIKSGIDLYADYGFYNAFPDDHGAQWTRTIQQTLPYYSQILLQIQPGL